MQKCVCVWGYYQVHVLVGQINLRIVALFVHLLLAGGGGGEWECLAQGHIVGHRGDFLNNQIPEIITISHVAVICLTCSGITCV